MKQTTTLRYLHTLNGQAIQKANQQKLITLPVPLEDLRHLEGLVDRILVVQRDPRS